MEIFQTSLDHSIAQEEIENDENQDLVITKAYEEALSNRASARSEEANKILTDL